MRVALKSRLRFRKPAITGSRLRSLDRYRWLNRQGAIWDLCRPQQLKHRGFGVLKRSKPRCARQIEPRHTQETGILYTFLANPGISRLFMTLDGMKEPS
jgi:hypothetical protein